MRRYLLAQIARLGRFRPGLYLLMNVSQLLLQQIDLLLLPIHRTI